MRTATAEDFKKGATIYNEYGGWVLLRLYDEGTWEARGKRGERIIYEGEARFFQVDAA